MIFRAIVLSREEVSRFLGLCGNRDDKGHVPWEGPTKTSHGVYGVFYLDDGEKRLAHRVAWTILRGQIPDDTDVVFDCGDRLCMNVDHMHLRALYLNTSRKGVKVCTTSSRPPRTPRAAESGTPRGSTLGSSTQDGGSSPRVDGGSPRRNLSAEQIRDVRTKLGKYDPRSVAKRTVASRLAERYGVDGACLIRAWRTGT